ncbi:MAG TPA: type II toxin-antitoxin system VapC family toxin [Rhodanobacteraceae bacterium]|nr:type II toxin-antitoxin system VapC family toxin [Rhodanobacteraceae bacterium]
MIGIDTNVLVRYLAQDDAKQSAAASRLFQSLSPASPAFVSQIVLAETIWVLESRYDAGAERVGQVIETLLRTDALQVERADVVWRALRRFREAQGDFPDALVTELALAAGCKQVYSFDRGAVKRSGMTPLE